MIIKFHCHICLNIASNLTSFMKLLFLTFDADLAHVYSKFIGPLPNTTEDFVSGLQAYFPHIIDTKVLLNSNNELLRITRRGSTSLSKVFSLLCPPIACRSTSNILADKCVKVEVQVEDQRFDFQSLPFMFNVYTLLNMALTIIIRLFFSELFDLYVNGWTGKRTQVTIEFCLGDFFNALLVCDSHYNNYVCL